ncbi:hypothetical protein JCM10295v2_006660 [Rhodotorula toruloides]
MPSFKSCLASLALLALAIAPVSAAATPVEGLAVRNVNAGSVGGQAAVLRRNAARRALEQRATKAQLARAKLAAKKKAAAAAKAAAAKGRQTVGSMSSPSPLNPQQAASAGGAAAAAGSSTASSSSASSSSSSPASSSDAYSPSSAFLNTKAALAASRLRCGSDGVCALRGPAVPANAAAKCISGKCTFRCNSGFAPGGADGTECVATDSSCGGVQCTVPANGYSTCSNGACVPGCNQGYTRYSANPDGSGAITCFDLQNDASNCGSQGNACPASYNGKGTAICKYGSCRVSCDPGYVLRKAQSTTNPYYCYNGEASLVHA